MYLRMIQILKALRGTFRESFAEKLGRWTIILLIGVFDPILFLCVLLEHNTNITSNLDRSIFLILILFFPAFAIYLFLKTGKSYEFTGLSVAELDRSGRSINVIYFDEVSYASRKGKTITLIASGKEMRIYAFRKLRVELQRIVDQQFKDSLPE